MHNSCSSSSLAGESLAYLQDKLRELMGQYCLLAHKYSKMVWQLHNCQDALHCSSKQSNELEKVNLELQKQLKQIMDVNQEICEQNQEINQASTPVSRTTALEQSSNESHGGQGYVLSSWVPGSKRDGAGPAAICDRCLMFTYHRSIGLNPSTTIEPLDASVSQDVNQAFALASITTALHNFNKSHGEIFALKCSVPESVDDEEHPATTAAGSLSCNYQRSISPNTNTEPFSSASIGTRVRRNLYHQINVLNSLVPEPLHDKAVPYAGCITCHHQSGISPTPFTTEPCNVSASPSNNYVIWRRYPNSQHNPVMPMPSVNVMAEVGNGSMPFVHTTWSQPAQFDGAHSPHCEAAACELGWNKLHSMVMMARCKVMKEQSSEQCRSPLTERASPLNQWGLRSGSLKGANEDSRVNTKAYHSTGLDGPNVGMTSPTLRRQSYDESPLIASVPKCISIRADSHTNQLKVSTSQKSDARVASNTAKNLSPIDHKKPNRYRRHGAPTTIEVQEQTKVVALAENLACLAFPQGMYKTEMCNKWVRSMGQYCPYGDKCQFAHGSHELRPVLRHHRYKTILCRMVAVGEPCPYEHRCHFRHVLYPHEAAILALNPIINSASSTSK